MIQSRCWSPLGRGLLLVLVASRLPAQQAPPGFQVELLYQAPDIEHPSAVTCDDQGNLFVGEDPMDMRGPANQKIDRILLIRWDPHGGPPVKSVFCENLSAVFGMAWHRGALYVMNAPYFTMLKDTDGDGAADVRTELADSFGHAPGLFGLNNHVACGIRLGLDGFLYVALGDKGLPKAVGTDGSTITLEGGGVFRMRPDARGLEIVSQGVRNNMDVALDQFDNIFAFDNDDDYGWWTRIIHHVPTGYYGYPYDYRSRQRAFLPPIGEFGSGTACGGACYLEAAWPARYQGSAFFCDWGESKIDRYTFAKNGASFEAAVEDFLLGDESGDFRPIDLCFSPDGRHMYVADWNHPGGGKKEPCGRLFRVTYVGDEVPREPARAKDQDGLEAQLRSLGHPAHHERMRAQQRLADMSRAAVEPVSELLKVDQRPLVRVHAIWTQNALADELKGYDPAPEWIAALQDIDADVRGQAARALGQRRVAFASPALAGLLTDPDAAVRMQAAVALGRIGQADSADALFAALGEPDRVARYTIMQALKAIGNWQPALEHLRKADERRREAILLALEGVFDGAAVDVLDRWFREAPDPVERASALRALAKVDRRTDPYTGGWWGGKAAGAQPARAQKHSWEETRVVLAAIAAGLENDAAPVRLAALSALRRVTAPETLPLARCLVDQDPNAEVRRQAIGLLAELKDTEAVPELLRVAADRQADDQVRAGAVQAVVAIDSGSYVHPIAELALADDSPQPLVNAALDALSSGPAAVALPAIEKRLTDSRAAVRSKAIEVYVRLPEGQVAERIIPRLRDPDESVQRAALLALSSAINAADAKNRRRMIEALSTSAEERALPIYLDALLDSDFLTREAARRALFALGDSISEDIRSLHERSELAANLHRKLMEIFATNQRFTFLREDQPAKLEPSAYVQYATTHRGDSQRGKQLFANAKGVGCIKCHSVGGAAAASIGPDLLGIGAKYPRRELIRSVLEPSNRILIDFEMVIVATTDGHVHQGMIRSQTPGAIELVTPEGSAVSIPAAEIELQKTSNLSPMPNGLTSGMSLQNFADIIAYLESLKQPSVVPVSQRRP